MANEYSYKKFFQEMYRGQSRISAIASNRPEELALWKERMKDKLNEILGMEQLKEIGSSYRGVHRKVDELERIKEEGYVRIKYRMETLPHVFMPFYMLIPDTVSKQQEHRLMIALPAHGANKDTVAGVISNDEAKEKLERAPKESYGREFVKRGYLVLCPDPPGYGERIEGASMEDKAFAPDMKISTLGSSCRNLAQIAEALGLSFQGLVLWDMMCLVDFAAEHTYVDPNRIGCAGFSGGGLYSLWLAAMDERIKLTVISGYLHGYYDSILETHLCPCNYLPKLWQYADVCDIASLIAPRYLFIENGIHDKLDGPRGIADPTEQAERIGKIYALMGNNECMEYRPFEGGHQWYGGCYDFVNRYL